MQAIIDRDTADENDLVCEDHDCLLEWADDGNGESGPGEPYLTCLKCEREHGPQCPECGKYEDEGFEVSTRWTKNYGGGWDTFYRCPCGYTEVCV